MSRPGIGVICGILGDNKKTEDAYHASMGKTISGLTLDEEGGFITIDFSDGTNLRVADEGQSCCENRYMRTDDDMQHFIGANWRDDSSLQVWFPYTHEELARLRETLQAIADADWRRWKELATPDEFVRWAKSRAAHALRPNTK